VITDIVIVVAAALFIGVYVSWRAGRIDRLHTRVDMAQAALDATLLRRSSVALELATSGLLDPATSLLLASAVHGTRGGDRPRDLAESDLTRALRAAFSQPDFRASIDGKEGADELLAEIEAAAHQVFLARKFKFTTREVPVEYIYCAEGSKISPYRDGLRMLSELFKLRWYSLAGAYSAKGLAAQSREQLSDVPVQAGQLSE